MVAIIMTYVYISYVIESVSLPWQMDNCPSTLVNWRDFPQNSATVMRWFSQANLFSLKFRIPLNANQHSGHTETVYSLKEQNLNLYSILCSLHWSTIQILYTGCTCAECSQIAYPNKAKASVWWTGPTSVMQVGV